MSLADPDDTPSLPPAPRARPYGLIGLAISSILIIASALALSIVAGLAIGAVAALIYGLQPTLDGMSALSASAGSDEKVLIRAGVVVSLAFYFVLSAVILMAARIRGGRGWRDVIGWWHWYPFGRAHYFWALAAVAIAYGVVIAFALPQLVPESKDWIKPPQGTAWIALFILLAVVFAPVTEELVFRGWLYTGLREKIGVWAGIAVTSALFALAHWESTHIYALAVLPLGAALGIAREKAASVKASMALHAIYNTSAVVLMLLGL